MRVREPNKRKIINDPVYGFIGIPGELIFDIIQHPYFQRLRRIKQLGLTHLVYPGAMHTRFQHALGAMHLMGQAVEVLRQKGFDISREEESGLYIAILLHDVGHGPYSHALEKSFTEGMNHEDLTLIFIDRLNETFSGKLTMARSIFIGEYHKKFLRQLVSSQLDVDRLDYLKRDSFYTGVSEGVISTDRIIKMLSISGEELAVEDKGIYSVEKFIIARRLMYWQVYLHKTVLAAEHLLIRIIRRAYELVSMGQEVFATPALKFFLGKKIQGGDFRSDQNVLEVFSQMDDYEIFTCVKVWCTHSDPVLSLLSRKMVDRQLFRIIIQKEEFDEELLLKLKDQTEKKYHLKPDQSDYFVFTGEVTNSAYNPEFDKINILDKNGEVHDITEASDQLNVQVLSKMVSKYFLCHPKEITLK